MKIPASAGIFISRLEPPGPGVNWLTAAAAEWAENGVIR
jgi:hypothetical protein